MSDGSGSVFSLKLGRGTGLFFQEESRASARGFVGRTAIFEERGLALSALRAGAQGRGSAGDPAVLRSCGICACGQHALQAAEGGKRGVAEPRGAGASGVCPGGGFQAGGRGAGK